jgi:1-phosphofructokinase
MPGRGLHAVTRTQPAVEVEGSNGAYLHDRRGGAREEIATTPGPELHRHELDDLYGVALTAGSRAAIP